MYIHHTLLIIHIIAATIWVGGHLVLAIGFMPKSLKHKDFSYIANFEKTYENEENLDKLADKLALKGIKL